MNKTGVSIRKICTSAAGIAAIIAAIAYGVRGGDVLSEFSLSAEILLCIAILLYVIQTIRPIPMLEYIPYLLNMCSLGIFLREEMDFLANVYTGLDGNVLDVPLIVILICMVSEIILGFIGIITTK